MVRIAEETRYPFEETVTFTINPEKPVSFPLYLRIPAWCKDARVAINGKPTEVKISAGKYVRIQRLWKEKDVVTLSLPMALSVTRWDRNHHSVSVNHGPLTFSLKIGERYDQFDSAKTAIGDSSWQKTADPSKWPSFEIHPTTPWNYGLILDDKNPAASFKITRRSWPEDDFPFTTEAAPIVLEASARQIPEWTLDQHGLCAPLQDSPVFSTQPVETVSLIPMGAARLRISAFPTIGSENNARRWKSAEIARPPMYQTSASHVSATDTLDALCDDLKPQHSNDQSIPRFTWWNRRGSTEWVQYDFPQARQVSSAAVYWFDDTGSGQCRVPESWRLFYKAHALAPWKLVKTLDTYSVQRDEWCRIRFAPVNAVALRIEAKLQPGFSGGILEWRIAE